MTYGLLRVKDAAKTREVITDLLIESTTLNGQDYLNDEEKAIITELLSQLPYNPEEEGLWKMVNREQTRFDFQMRMKELAEKGVDFTDQERLEM